MENRYFVAFGEVRYILLCLALVLLSCALKNYLVYFLSDTVFCEHLCPSVFGRDVFSYPEPINQFYRLHQSIVDVFQRYFNVYLFNDRLHLISGLIVIPLIEEAIYRGPLYLTRKYAASPVWWLAVTVLVTLFTLSHDRSGLALLPIFVLGLSSCWLIKVTGKFWPSLILHFLNNFFFFSIILYQAALWGE